MKGFHLYSFHRSLSLFPPALLLNIDIRLKNSYVRVKFLVFPAFSRGQMAFKCNKAVSKVKIFSLSM